MSTLIQDGKAISVGHPGNIIANRSFQAVRGYELLIKRCHKLWFTAIHLEKFFQPIANLSGRFSDLVA
jgi:hypothetical protein